MKFLLKRRWTPLVLVAAMTAGVLSGAEVLSPARSAQSDLLQAIIAPRA